MQNVQEEKKTRDWDLIRIFGYGVLMFVFVPKLEWDENKLDPPNFPATVDATSVMSPSTQTGAI